MRVDEVSPRLDEILNGWARASAGIKKLEGRHNRFVYDTTFKTEKRTEGYFYFEAPDHGRIDFNTVEIHPGDVGREDPVTNERYRLESDRPQIWIVDGEKVLHIDPVEKTADVLTIPPEQRGQAITEGPLPFLFGLPAEQAKQRFQLELLGENFGKHNEIRLLVRPRREEDAANWSQAMVQLNRSTYLPTAVQLTDPAGTSITSYVFTEPRINQPEPLIGIFKKDPFKYPLRGYKLQVDQNMQLPAQAQAPVIGPAANAPPGRIAAAAGIPVPSVVDMNHKEASQVLAKEGFSVKIKRGAKPPTQKMLYHVQEQRPSPNSLASPGQEVFLFLYQTEKTPDNGPQPRTAARPGAPN
jgi:TIGR03009 family protein